MSPAFTHEQARSMALVELARFLDLLQELAPQDWDKPTACTLWDVRQVVAHATGAAASYASWSQLIRQWNPLVQRPYRQRGLTFLDALNQIQVDDRAADRPDDLIAELRAVGPARSPIGTGCQRPSAPSGSPCQPSAWPRSAT